MPLIYAYIKKTENKIVYVGQTINLENRRYDHEKQDPYNKNLKEYNYPLSRGIRKYGIQEYECKILEDNIPESDIDEREIFWIKYYNTYEDPTGYNLTPGGKGGKRHYKFDKDLIMLAKQKIKQGIAFSEISKETGISIVMLSEINTGKRHYDDNETYPLYSMTRGRKNTDDNIEKVYSLLKEGKLTIKEISSLTGVKEYTIADINSGKVFKKENEKYPIRSRVVSGKRKTLSNEELLSLIDKISNSKISFFDLSQEYGVSISTIYNINKGISRKIESLNYPLRK